MLGTLALPIAGSIVGKVENESDRRSQSLAGTTTTPKLLPGWAVGLRVAVVADSLALLFSTMGFAITIQPAAMKQAQVLVTGKAS